MRQSSRRQSSTPSLNGTVKPDGMEPLVTWRGTSRYFPTSKAPTLSQSLQEKLNDNHTMGEEVDPILNFGKDDPVFDDDIQMDEFEGECGYWIVKMLRGRTTGRRLKRDIFKSAMWQAVCGTVLIVIVAQEESSYAMSQWMSRSKVGKIYMDLAFAVGILSFLIGLVTLYLVRHWASLVTNREILGCCMYLHLTFMVVILFIGIWSACAYYLAFKNFDWRTNIDVSTILPFFIVTTIFLVPYLLYLLLLCMNIWYTSDEIYMGGIIAEPEPSHALLDISHLSPSDSIFFCLALPIATCIQLFDAMYSFLRLLRKCFFGDALMPWEADPEGDRRSKKRKKTFLTKIWKFFVRCWRSLKRCCLRKSSNVLPVAESAGPMENPMEQRLRDLRAKHDREEQERLNRERKEALDREAEEKRRVEEEEAERLRLAALREEEALKRQKQQEAEEAAALQQSKGADNVRQSPTLSVSQYKAMWSTLETGGSFQCKLKVEPTMHALSEHLRKQGFHIVFANNGASAASASASSSSLAAPKSPDSAKPEMELGICNVRETGMGPWFLARFIVSAGCFSAVMKCEEISQVPVFVKKFTLAKVLKIDSSGGGAPK